MKKLLGLFLLVCNINASDTTLVQVAGSPFASGTGPNAIAITAVLTSGKVFAAVANSTDGTVSIYDVNNSTGNFTEVSGSPFATGNGPAGVAFTFPTIINPNVFLALTDSVDNTVSVFTVNQDTGSLTSVAGSPFNTGSNPTGIAFKQDITTGNIFAAITNLNSNNISVYSVNPITGLFTPVSGSPFAAGTNPNSIAFTTSLTSGKTFAAAANFSDSTVSVYEVNTTTGNFTPVSNSPFVTGASPNSIAFSSNLTSGNLFAAVANSGDGTVSVYDVNTTTGEFTSVTGSPISAGTSPFSIAFTRNVSAQGLFAAVANLDSNNISLYRVNQITGEFTPLRNSPFAAGTHPTAIAFAPFSPFVAAANFVTSNISVFRLVSAARICTEPSDLLTKAIRQKYAV